MELNHEQYMRPTLYDEEPAVENWELVGDDGLHALVERLLPPGPNHLILVDGRSGSGKSTFATRLARLLEGQVVHTDDIAWNYDIIDWDGALVQGVVEPWRAGQDVSYRPPGWVKMGREGAVEVSASPLLIVEGVSSGRKSLAELADLVVWVQSDNEQARTRGIERDMQSERPDPVEAERFWDEWMSTETPYLNKERSWEHAQLIVNGTPTDSDGEGTYISAGPLLPRT